MRKFILTGCLILLVCGFSFADVQIDKKNRVQNKSPGYCAWCCLETLGRNQNIKSMENLVDNRAKDGDWIETRLIQINQNSYREEKQVYSKNLGALGAVRQKLDLLKVKYRITQWNREHLQEAVKENGCIVYMKPSSLWSASHAIILTDINNKTFSYIDPNGCNNWQGTREWFDRHWDGTTISITE